jgi:hypothetical protein
VLGGLCGLFDSAQAEGATALQIQPSLQADQAALFHQLPVLRMPAQPLTRPNWRAVAGLPAKLAAAGEQTRAAYEVQSQAARLAWLDGAQVAWEDTLAQLETVSLAAQGWPRLGMHLAALQMLRSQLLDFAQAAGEGLELASRRFEQATEALSGARRRLEAVCSSLPACSWTGAVAALMQPWQWPRWVYSYWQHLPPAVQQFSRAQEDKIRRQTEEAAWHTLRQHYLAAAQQAQAQTKRLLEVQRGLHAAQELAMQLSAQKAAALPDPWTHAGLAWLLDRLLPTPTAVAANDVVTALLQHSAEPETVAEVLHERIGAMLADVRTWSALDCLCAALAAGAADSRAGAIRLVSTWLQQQSHVACPLWPSQELAENTAGEEWWLMPHSRAQTAWVAEVSAAAVGEEARHAALAYSNLDAVQIVRWSEVQVDLETTSAVDLEEELPNEHS